MVARDFIEHSRSILVVIMSAIIQVVAGKTGMNPKEAERFLKFMVVGLVGAVVDFGSYNILLTVFERTNLAESDWVTTIAGTISFTLAIISNFIWNRYWTYPDSRGKKIFTQFVQFFFCERIGNSDPGSGFTLYV